MAFFATPKRIPNQSAIREERGRKKETKPSFRRSINGSLCGRLQRYRFNHDDMARFSFVARSLASEGFASAFNVRRGGSLCVSERVRSRRADSRRSSSAPTTKRKNSRSACSSALARSPATRLHSAGTSYYAASPTRALSYVVHIIMVPRTSETRGNARLSLSLSLSLNCAVEI